jgi:hypothetical protein
MINFAVQPDKSLDKDTDDPAGSPVGMPGERKLEKTSKPLTAGVLLIVVFAFILFTVINTSIGTYLMLNPEGDTTVEGIVEDGDGDPVEGVTVTIEDTDIVEVTDAEGKYKISQVSAGEHTFKFYKPGYRVLIVRHVLYSKDALDQSSVKSNELDVPSYIPGGTYTGYFKGPFIQVTENPLINSTVIGTVRDNDDSPLANVNVTVAGTTLFVTTDTTGNFRLENVTAGVHEFKAVNGTAAGSDFVSIITLIKPEDVVNIDFIFDDVSKNKVIDQTQTKNGKISGRVVDDQSDPSPLAGAEVWLESAESTRNYTASVFTNSNGTFEFTNIPLGIYNISATAENFNINKTSNLVVDHNLNLTENFELTELNSPVKATADVGVVYYCLLGLVIIAIIALLGGISAYRRKRYGLAFAAAVLSVGPAILLYTDSFICGAAVISVVALLLIVLSKNEFEAPRIE